MCVIPENQVLPGDAARDGAGPHARAEPVRSAGRLRATRSMTIHPAGEPRMRTSRTSIRSSRSEPHASRHCAFEHDRGRPCGTRRRGRSDTPACRRRQRASVSGKHGSRHDAVPTCVHLAAEIVGRQESRGRGRRCGAACQQRLRVGHDLDAICPGSFEHQGHARGPDLVRLRRPLGDSHSAAANIERTPEAGRHRDAAPVMPRGPSPSSNVSDAQ